MVCGRYPLVTQVGSSNLSGRTILYALLLNPLAAPRRAIVPVNGVAVGAELAGDLSARPIGGYATAPVDGAARALSAFVAQLQIPLSLPDAAALRTVPAAIPGAIQIWRAVTASTRTPCPVGAVRPVDGLAVAA